MAEIFEVEKLENDSAICKCATCESNYFVKYKSDARRSVLGNLCKKCKYFICEMEINQINVRKAFIYETETGNIYHRNNTVSGKAGKDATKKHIGGYRSIKIGKKEFLAHRIIFMYMKGYFPTQVDHKNHNRSDNRWKNLRDVQHIDNCKNQSMSKSNTSTITGVALHKPTGKYRAYINKDYKQIHLGLFETIEEAKKARNNANIKYQYHENHGV